MTEFSIVCTLLFISGITIGFLIGFIVGILQDKIDWRDFAWDINYYWAQDIPSENQVYVDNYSKWVEDCNNE